MSLGSFKLIMKWFERQNGHEIWNMIQIRQQRLVHANDVLFVSVFQQINIFKFPNEIYTPLTQIHCSSLSKCEMYFLSGSIWFTIFSANFRLIELKTITSCSLEIWRRNSRKYGRNFTVSRVWFLRSSF